MIKTLTRLELENIAGIEIFLDNHEDALITTGAIQEFVINKKEIVIKTDKETLKENIENIDTIHFTISDDIQPANPEIVKEVERYLDS